MSHFFQTLKLIVCLALVAGLPRLASALVVGPYTPDANTAYLFHFNEPAGSSVATNAAGSLAAGTNAISYDGTTLNAPTADQPTITTLLGASGFSGFGNAANIANVAHGLGVDINGNGGFELDEFNIATPTSSDRLADHSTLLGANNGFTIEAMINLSALTGLGNREIFCTDNGDSTAGDRGFQFRISNTGLLEFNFIGSTPAGFTVAIPTTGPEAWVANEWFHVALTHEAPGGLPTTKVYWTRVDSTRTQATPLLTNTVETLDINDDALLIIGNEGRGASGEGLRGLIDEVRISKVARAADQMIFAPSVITFTTQPTNSLTIATNQSATFSAVATGLGTINYQWFTTNSGVFTALPDQTNAALTITAGAVEGVTNYVVVASNGGFSTPATSQVATLTIRLPNELRWFPTTADWDTGTLNWTADNGTTTTNFIELDKVTFDSLGIGQSIVTLNADHAPVSVTVDTSAADYSIGGSGAIVGAGSLVKNSTGTLTLTTSNTFSGGIVINSGTLQLDNAGQPGTGPVANNGTILANGSGGGPIFPAAISGSGTFTVQSGDATLSASNSYSGQTTIPSGRVFARNGWAFGSGVAGTTVGTGGQVYFTVNTDFPAENFTIEGGGDGNGALRKGGSGATALAGTVSMAGDSTIGVDSGATLTLSNTLSGTASLTKVGNGTLALSAANSYNGVTAVDGGVLALYDSGALGSSTQVNVSSTTGGALGGTRVTLGAGVNISSSVALSLPTAGTTVRSTLFAAGASSWSGPITINGDNTASPGDQLAFASAGGFLTIGGSITGVNFPGTLQLRGDGTGAGSGAAVTNGYGGLITGAVVLGENATLQIHDGTTWTIASSGNLWSILEIAKGTLRVGASDALPATNNVKFGAVGDATLDLNGFNAQVGQLTYVGNVATVTNSSTTSDSTLTYSNTAATYFAGQIKEGARKLNLTIAGGTLTVSNAASLSLSNSTVSIAGGAALQLEFVATNQVGALVLNGVSQPNGVYGSSTPGGYLAGTGSLRVGPAGPSVPATLTNSVSGSNLTLSWPAGEGWRLETQTNSLSVGLGTNWVDVTPGSASSTNITIDPAQPAAFYRLVYP